MEPSFFSAYRLEVATLVEEQLQNVLPQEYSIRLGVQRERLDQNSFPTRCLFCRNQNWSRQIFFYSTYKDSKTNIVMFNPYKQMHINMYENIYLIAANAWQQGNRSFWNSLQLQLFSDKFTKPSFSPSFTLKFTWSIGRTVYYVIFHSFWLISR